MSSYFKFMKLFNNFIFLFITFSLFSLYLSDGSTCTEQWTDVNTSLENWLQKGDFQLTEPTYGKPIFTFGPPSSYYSGSTNYFGESWLKTDLSKTRGFILSFKPEIYAYVSSITKYPEGFAIVFTASDPEKFNLGQNESLGYEGIITGFVFEFDFIQNSEKGDSEKPHLSFNYNINGILSANTLDRTDSLYNIELPNFYDSTKSNYDNNIYFEIKIFNSQLTVTAKSSSDQVLINTAFPQFYQLLEKGYCSMGITSTGNGDSGVVIKDLKLQEISMNKKGYLEIENAEIDSNGIPNVKAGEKITLNFYIQSLCGVKLRIYQDEINEKDFKFKLNQENLRPESINYDEDSNKYKIIFYSSVAKIYTAVVEFKGYDSYPFQFKIIANDAVSRIDLCSHGTTEANKYYSTSILNQAEGYFYIPLCIYDYYGNLKNSDISRIGSTKIKYPYNLIPDYTADLENDSENKRVLLKILFSTFGTYEIYVENLIDQKKRYVNLMPEYISPDKSQVSILYEQNIIQSSTSKINLRIKIKDNYNRDIPVKILQEMNCDFSSSKIKYTSEISTSTNEFSVTSQYKDDYVILSVNKPSARGNYIFVPKVKCTNIDLVQFICGINSATNINNCQFSYPSDEINENYIKIFDEKSEDYITLQKDVTSEERLYISLDEKNNQKLTEIILLDDRESNYLSNIPQEIAVTLDSVELTVKQIGNKYSLSLPSTKTRYDYSPVKLYELVITFKTNNIFKINVKFYFLDKYMSNVDITQTDSNKISYIAFYKQNSFTLEAQETLLLFEIYELSEGKYLGNINGLLDQTKVTININNVESTNCETVNHNNFFLSVFCHDFTKEGVYSISLLYNGNELINKEITIIPQNEAYYLADESGTKISSGTTIEINKESLIKFLMLDKYENIIKDNRIFSVFAKIKISENDIFTVKQNYDSGIHIFNEGIISDKSITLTLINGNTYIIKSIYSPTFDDNMDILNSYGILTNDSPIIESNTDITLSLYFRDKYGNYISGTVDTTNINVYIEGKNLIEIITMTSSDTSASDGKIDYKGSVGKNGDFLIKIFINNLPVECRGCHFRKNYIQSENQSNTILTILDNKRKTKVFNSYSLSNKKVGLVNKNNFFSFYFEKFDSNSNEIKKEDSVASITLNFESETSGVDTSAISFCEKETGYYELCENVFSFWNKLPDGIYIITNNDLKYKFYIYLTDNFIDSSSSTPIATNSYIDRIDTTLYGKLDAPVSFVLDLRSSNYKRIEFDESRIWLYNRNGLKNIKVSAIKGPEKGLITIFLIATVPDTYAFYLQYSSNTKLINSAIRYVCSCGSDILLKPAGSDFLNNGNYAFFHLIDQNGNVCTSVRNWNPFNEKNFGNYVFKAEKDGKVFKTESYYNHITSTFIIYVENFATENINFSSNIFNFVLDVDYFTTYLMENIIDENHFYASISDASLKVYALNAIYQPAFECNIDGIKLYLTLIRIVNDDFVVLRNDYVFEDNFCEFSFDISSDDDLMDAKGKYLYIVYYQGKEIFCQNCMIEKTTNNIDMTKIKVYHKEGDNQYFQNDDTMILPLFKTNLPFFKVNIMTGNNNLVILDNGLKITLKTVNDDSSNDIIFNIGVKYSSNGNIYIYLNTDDRSKYWALDSMQKIQLTITYGSDSYITNYYAMDNYVKRLRGTDSCDASVAPMIINQQSLYIKRYDEDLELEIRLSNCLSLNLEIYETIKVIDTESSNQFNAELIPSDMPGSYYLFLPKNLEVSDSKKYYLLNNYNLKSEEFKLSVMPGYDIASIEFKSDENMDDSNGEKINTYFLFRIKDKYNNIITNVGRNLFATDIFAFSVNNNLPYKISYDESLQYFRCQVPIFHSVQLKAQSLISETTFNIDIQEPKIYRNTLVTLESEVNNLFTFSFALKDDFYNDITSSDYTSDISFRYITINPLTEQIFLKKVSSTYLGNNKFTVQLDNTYPKYSFYGFIPYIQFFPQICPSCMAKNLYPGYIYLIKNDSLSNLEPHDIKKKIYFIKDYEIPSFVYLAHGDITVESSDVTINSLVSTDSTKYYSLVYDGSTESITINFAESNGNNFIFKATFIDYSLTTTSSNTPSYTGIFGDYIYSPNFGEKQYITFFIEIRDGSSNLISHKPTLYKDNTYSNLISSIKVINTCFIGIYLIEVNLSKSVNIDFYLKYSQSQTKTSSDELVFINSIPSFPTYVSLEDKEVVNRNSIKFLLNTYNSQSEVSCDDRLNLYMEGMNLKGSHITIDNFDNKCELYVIFGGYATIKSNINNYVAEVNNNDKSLYNISPQFSTMSITPNKFSSAEEALFIKFIEKSQSKRIYGTDEFNANKTLSIYKYISPNKFQLINTITNLASNEYVYTPNDLGIIDRKIYIFIGSVASSTMSPIISYYQPEQASNSDIKSIEAIYFNDEQKYNILTNFALTKTYTGESFGLILPFLLRLKFLDEKGNDLAITSGEGKKIRAKLILANDSGEKISIDLILRQFNDKYFFIQHDPATEDKLIHLPAYLTDQSLKYFIKVSYDSSSTINLYSLLSLNNKNRLQSTSLKNRYSYPDEISSLSSFKIFTVSYANSISIPNDKSNKNYICLYTTNNGEEIIYNRHLDLNNAAITISNCDEFNIANSYMGCFELYVYCAKQDGVDMKLSVTYNSVASSSEISVDIFDAISYDFTLNEGKSSTSVEYTGDSTTSAILYFTTSISSLNNDLFKVFINGEKTENVQISNPEGVSGALNFVISNLETSPKTKNLMILFEDGANTQQLLLNREYTLTVNQKTYTDSLLNNYYTFKVQDPLNLKVGENIFFYLLILDQNNACYYGDFNFFSTMTITITKGTESYTTYIKSKEAIEDIPQCEYVYLVDFGQSTNVAGEYDVSIKDGSNQFDISSVIHISPNDIDESQITIQSEETEVEAGHNIYLTLSGTDLGGNSVNYYDIIDKLDINLIDSEGNTVEKKDANYFYDIRVNSDNSGIEIYLKINNYGTYTLQVVKSGTIMNLNNIYQVKVNPLECSKVNPELSLLPISGRYNYYTKERITIEIQCKDIFGNQISQQGNEIFKAYIISVNDNKISDFDGYFSDGLHYITFYVEQKGTYNIDVTLNGQKYGESLNLEINYFDGSKYVCMDKREVNNLVDCDTSNYRAYISNLLGSEYVCDTTSTKGALYKCQANDIECVENTNQCDCQGNPWQGYCYPDSVNPISQVTDGLVTCTYKISEAYPCGDGSCRYNFEECLTDFECPLGYKSCANRCIFISQDCNINIECNTDEVLCWDLTCANGYDKCPTRITCNNNKILCPDGSCQPSGHCAQPPITECEDGLYLCSDYSCVENSNDCPKNTVCEPGYSLCEDKTCNKYCKKKEEEEKEEVIQQQEQEEESSSKAGVIAGVIGGIGGAILIGGTLFYFLYWRKRKLNTKNVVIEINTDGKNLNEENPRERVDVYNVKKESNKEIIKDITEQHNVHELIEGDINPIKESIENFRSIKNAKK